MASILDKIKTAYSNAVKTSTPTVADIASGNYAGAATAKATPTATNKTAVTVTVPTTKAPSTPAASTPVVNTTAKPTNTPAPTSTSSTIAKVVNPSPSDIASGNYAGSATAVATPTSTNKAAVTVRKPIQVNNTPTINNSGAALGSGDNGQSLLAQQARQRYQQQVAQKRAEERARQQIIMPRQMSATEAAMNDRVAIGAAGLGDVNDMLNYGVLKDLQDLKNAGLDVPTLSNDNGGSTGSRGTASNSISAEEAAYQAYLLEAMQQQRASQERLLKEQFDRQEQQRRDNLNATIKANNDNAEAALREAYIANMMAQRNLPQQLKANGISGGATETTYADIMNTYMNNRNNIEKEKLNANAQARLAFDNGVADDYNDYLTNQYKLAGSNAETALKAAQSSIKTKSSGSTGTKSSGGGSTTREQTRQQLQAINGTVATNLTAYYKSLGYSDDQIKKILQGSGYVA